MRISIVVACSENNAIGKNNALLWHLPADLQHFKKITLGKPIVMGRKTYQSIGRPLPHRLNIIVTHDKNFMAEGCTVVHSIQSALSLLKNQEEVCVIGGAELYRQMLSMADRIYLTRVHHVFQADTFFPEFDLSEWKEVERVERAVDDKNPFACSFLTLEKNNG